MHFAFLALHVPQAGLELLQLLIPILTFLVRSSDSMASPCLAHSPPDAAFSSPLNLWRRCFNLDFSTRRFEISTSPNSFRLEACSPSNSSARQTTLHEASASDVRGRGSTHSSQAMKQDYLPVSKRYLIPKL